MRRVFFGCLAALCLAVGLRAGDPWKDKPHKDWDEKDIRRILNDSPWSRRVSVSANWVKSGGEDSSAPPQLRPPGSEAREGGYVGAVQTPGVPEGSREEPNQAVFLVRWSSSATIRRALVRGAILRHAMTEADGEKFLAQAPEEYEVRVAGQDMQPFSRTDEMALKASASLRPKSSHQKISPSRVEIERADDGKQIRAVVFHFPKKVLSGEAVVPAGEKGVEFSCQAGGVSLRASFEIQKMSTKEGLDL